MFCLPKPKNSMIRQLPYPYLGALSISNDIEFTQFNYFENLMKFLNSNRKTPLGLGLNLEISSSLFFFSVNESTFTYFNGTKPEKNYNSVYLRINDYLKSKWIDTNHAYGDFDSLGGFTRNHAKICYEVLSELDVNLNIFTNHGSADNVQNIGKDASYHKGDVEGHIAYHSDLMKKNNIEFIWTDSFVEEIQKKKKNNIYNKLFYKPRKLIKKIEVQDNNSFNVFHRFRSTGLAAPNLSSFKNQIEKINWDLMYENNYAIIIYQHFGVLYRIAGKCFAADFNSIMNRNYNLLYPFYFLQKEKEKGHLWVCALHKILRYTKIIQDIDIIYNDFNGIIEIIYPEEIYGNIYEFFQGITFFINPRKKYKIIYKDQDLSFQCNGPDNSGKYSISIPLKKMSDIW